jgi:hypothetical protein
VGGEELVLEMGKELEEEVREGYSWEVRQLG